MAGTDPSAETRGFHHRREHVGPASEIPLLDGTGEDGTDYRYLYELVTACAEREEDRGKALDTKVTSLLAGVVAFIGFSFRVQSTVWNAVSALAFIIPLLFLFSAFMPKRANRGPSPRSLVTYFRSYPVKTLHDAIQDVTNACTLNQDINDRKAARLDIAVLLTAIATALVLLEQVALDVVHP